MRKLFLSPVEPGVFPRLKAPKRKTYKRILQVLKFRKNLFQPFSFSQAETKSFCKKAVSAPRRNRVFRLCL
ncbi:hypothetical protein DWY99_09550 [[Clostridium] leptum]|uniref:Uncharacterized protein n=1 Tax=[Clostridium] leptum TaxID=1535 RepID=A0A412AW45_9FIRM|nr:hypothetical protein DWY99_09550 [[Clostridium] leptum]